MPASSRDPGCAGLRSGPRSGFTRAVVVADNRFDQDVSVPPAYPLGDQTQLHDDAVLANGGSLTGWAYLLWTARESAWVPSWGRG